MDPEIMSVIVDLNDLTQVHVMNYVTVYFGLVIAAYFVADKLPTFVVISILVVFTLFTILNLSSIDSAMVRATDLRELYDAQLPGSWKLSETDGGWRSIAGQISFALMYLFSYVSGIGSTIFRKMKGAPN
ncbi:MAG: hypothetical protein ACI9ON_001226 [Limisphaerales bacterium]|jgi:hypothetical protein